MKEKYIEDLHEIKEIMNRSSRFISLSGTSGIVAGILALVGVYVAYQQVYIRGDYLRYEAVSISSDASFKLLIIASATLLLAIGSGIFFTNRRVRETGQHLGDIQTKRLLINLFVPLATGGILCLIFLQHGFVGLTAPLTLIFYGLALFNASKYTLKETRSLGLLEIMLGLVALFYMEYSLLFWAVGFGLLHIIYGTMMHIRYKS